jgi:LAGLIDADG DNA endonuclease family/Cytochrome C oxidase subunit II, transmembrane domain
MKSCCFVFIWLTLLELIWTISPAFILLAIAFPSFRLLYLLDEVVSPTITIKVVGLLIDGLKSNILNKIKGTKVKAQQVFLKLTLAPTSCFLGIPFLLLSGSGWNGFKKLKGFGQKNMIQKLNNIYPVALAPSLKKKIFFFLQLGWGEGVGIKILVPSQYKNKNKNSRTLLKKNFISEYKTFHNISIQKYSMSNITNGLNISKQFFHSRCRAINRIGPHNIDVISVIFGLLLGDGYASNRSGEGVRISIKQSIIHKEYLFSLYYFFFFRGYSFNSEPRLCNKKNKGRNKIYPFYEFKTYRFRSFVWIYNLFYSKGKKVVKLELEKYLTPRVLAFWIISYGKFINGELQLNTSFHTSKDIEKLISLLKNRYGLISYMYENKKDLYFINISKESINSLLAIVFPFIKSNTRYKIDFYSPCAET